MELPVMHQIQRVIHANTNRRPDRNQFIDQLFLFPVPTASPADIQRIREAIKNATSLSEVERLTRILQSGNIPEDISEQNGNGNG